MHLTCDWSEIFLTNSFAFEGNFAQPDNALMVGSCKLAKRRGWRIPESSKHGQRLIINCSWTQRPRVDRDYDTKS